MPAKMSWSLTILVVCLLGVDAVLRLQTTPTRFNSRKHKQVTLTCSGEVEPYEAPYKLVVWRVGDGEVIAYVDAWKGLKFGSGYRKGMKIKGVVGGRGPHSLAVTITNPGLSDLGSYGCLMKYVDPRYSQYKQAEAVGQVSVEDIDLTDMVQNLAKQVLEVKEYTKVQDDALKTSHKMIHDQFDHIRMQEQRLTNSEHENNRLVQIINSGSHLNGKNAVLSKGHSDKSDSKSKSQDKSTETLNSGNKSQDQNTDNLISESKIKDESSKSLKPGGKGQFHVISTSENKNQDHQCCEKKSDTLERHAKMLEKQNEEIDLLKEKMKSYHSHEQELESREAGVGSQIDALRGKVMTLTRNISSQEDKLNDTSNSLMNEITSLSERASFQVAFSNSYVPKSSTPAIGSPLLFANTVTDIGNAYNVSTGEFVAPRHGVYVFHLSVWMMNKEELLVVLRVKDVEGNLRSTETLHCSNGISARGMQSSVSSVTELQAGDKTFPVVASIFKQPGTKRFSGPSKAFFSGYLLHEIYQR